MFELFLSKTPNKEASPATARQARHTTEKYSFHFARPRFLFLLMKRVFFCGVLPSKYSGRWRGCPLFVFARSWRNSPQTPLPPRPRFRRQFFWRTFLIKLNYQTI